MALKDNWEDKVDYVDWILASDINKIAHAVIALENELYIDTEEEL